MLNLLIFLIFYNTENGVSILLKGKLNVLYNYGNIILNEIGSTFGKNINNPDT